MDAFNGDFCRCDHSIQNLMVSKTFILGLTRLKLWLVACSCGQYTGLCVFGALRKVASVLAFAGLRAISINGGCITNYATC